MSRFFRDIFSKESLETAWIRVRDNRGCRGSDGVTIDEFESDLQHNLQLLANDITDNNYFPFPLLRFSIPKRKSTGVRYLSVPTVRDRVAQAAAYLGCREIFEKEFESISHAYRQGRGTRTAIEEIRSWRQKGYRFALDVDIDDYFDSVPHDLLIKKLEILLPEPELTDIFEKWIRVEVYDGNKVWRLQKGIPQGSVVSPILANLYLDELDEMLMSFDRKLVRYADDCVPRRRTGGQSPSCSSAA
jgi:group II intron reverse transcriptase/maturase